MRAGMVFLLKVCLREINGGGGAVVAVSRKSRLCRYEARLCNLPPPVSATLLRLAFADRRRRREAVITREALVKLPLAHICSCCSVSSSSSSLLPLTLTLLVSASVRLPSSL